MTAKGNCSYQSRAILARLLAGLTLLVGAGGHVKRCVNEIRRQASR